VLNDPLQLAFSAIPHPSLGLHYTPTSTGLNTADSLPPNVHILTSKWLNCSTVLLRLSHMFQHGEHPVLSQQASVQLSAVAKLLRLDVSGVQEATLFGERPLAEMDARRTSYNCSGTITKWQPPLVLPDAGVSFTSNRLVGSIPLETRVTLNPMQIRAFYLAVRRSRGDGSCIDPPQFSKPVAAAGGGVTGAAGMEASTLEAAVIQAQAVNTSASAVSTHAAVVQLVADGLTGTAGKQAATVDKAATQQVVNASVSLLSIRIDPTIAKVALLSRGVLLLLVLVPTGVAFGIASCVFGRGSPARSRSASPQNAKLKGLV
jgi:hypothetical protein